MEKFLEAVARGEYRRELFIFRTKADLAVFKLELADTANALNLRPLATTASRHNIEFDGNPSVLLLRVARPYLDREVRGQEFHAIHGLDYFHAIHDGDAIRQLVESRIRL